MSAAKHRRPRKPNDDWRARQQRTEIARAVADADECAAAGDPPRPLVAYDGDERIVVMECPPWNFDPAMYEIETRNIVARFGKSFWPLHLLPRELRHAIVDRWAERELVDDARNPRLNRPHSDDDEDDG